MFQFDLYSSSVFLIGSSCPRWFLSMSSADLWPPLPAQLKHSLYFLCLGHRPQRGPKLEDSLPVLSPSVDLQCILCLAGFFPPSMLCKRICFILWFSLKSNCLAHFFCCLAYSSNSVVFRSQILDPCLKDLFWVTVLFVFFQICTKQKVQGTALYLLPSINSHTYSVHSSIAPFL